MTARVSSKPIKCIDCDKQIYRNSSRHKRCFECKEEDHRRRSRERYRKNTKMLLAQTRAWKLAHPSSPELITVTGHYQNIVVSERAQSRTYKDMPFFDGWNPRKGGSLRAGELWLIKNLGRRPEGSTLHIVHHDLGFVPGNLEWTHPRKQISQQMHKIIAQQRNEIKSLKAKIKELRKMLRSKK